MKFAHIADCHIGGWREDKLRNLPVLAFEKAIDMSLERGVDFILIAGDLFNTALPGVDYLKRVTRKLKEVNEKKVPVYAIAGSHDYSPSGKTMIDVLEEAGLLRNVLRGRMEDEVLKLNFTEDKTGAKITGVLGRKGLLDKTYYEKLNKKELEEEEGFKIFMFHTAISELKPEELQQMNSLPLSFLPKNFDYYAGGHVHDVKKVDKEEYGTIAMPGALFPNNFSELEKYKRGGFYLYDEGDVSWVPVRVKGVESFEFDCNLKSPEQVEREILKKIEEEDVKDKIVTLRLEGDLQMGRSSDIGFNEIFKNIYDKGAYFVMRNTSKLIGEDFEEVKIKADTVEEIEEGVIKEHLGQVKVEGMEKEDNLMKELIQVLDTEKKEGENKSAFERRVKEEVDEVLEVENE